MSRGTRDGEFGNVGRMVIDRLRQVLDGEHIAQHTLYAIAQAAQRSTGQEQDINHINCLVGAMAWHGMPPDGGPNEAEAAARAHRQGSASTLATLSLWEPSSTLVPT